MEFDQQWLLLALPLMFALGWLASRLDVRQWKREQKDSRQVYYKGLNLLLNEQHDKAIDAFIEAVQQDPDTSDLHFALGDLFRRRGEYERAVRVHEHLLHRGDLPAAERDRAQHALAQDFMRAGLFDRAEEAYRALEGTSFDTDARLALLTLYERSREWRAAVEVAGKLEQRGTGSFASRMAHYWCELALEADAKRDAAEAEQALKRAREAAPQAARPLILAGRAAAKRGDHNEALSLWGTLLVTQPGTFNLVAREYAASALACGEFDTARERLSAAYHRTPTLDLLDALALIDADPAAVRGRLVAHLRQHPSLSAARQMLGRADDYTEGERGALREAVGRAAQPLNRYRCAACGFETQHYHWQCLGCLNWDSYPPQRLEDLP